MATELVAKLALGDVEIVSGDAGHTDCSPAHSTWCMPGPCWSPPSRRRCSPRWSG
jgi:hypothetical protein